MTYSFKHFIQVTTTIVSEWPTHPPTDSCQTPKNGSKGKLHLLARNESLQQWFSELARGLTCPCKPVGHATGHRRKITPGTFTRLVLQDTVKTDMSIDELARTYITNIERQQRAQST